MNKWILGIVASAVLALPAAAQEGTATAEHDEAAMMEAMQKYGTPGDEHANLKPLVGNWSYTSSFWMAPGTEPMKMTGSTSSEWAHGGRYLTSDVTGTMMGMPFSGTGIMGYDRYKDEVFSFWVDNMGTGAMMSRGEFSDDGKTITYEGTYDDYMNGVEDKWSKTVIKIDDNDHNTWEMFEKGEDGKEIRTFLIENVRAGLAEADTKANSKK